MAESESGVRTKSRRTKSNFENSRMKSTIAGRAATFNFANISRFMVGIFLLAVVAASAGQSGSITGAVVDPTGAVIPGVTVAISNLATGQQQSVSTNADGTFMDAELAPGSSGWKSARRDSSRWSKTASKWKADKRSPLI